MSRRELLANPDLTRVLIAPCGCVAGADVTDEVPGFCRSIEEAREDIRNGFTESLMSLDDFAGVRAGLPAHARVGSTGATVLDALAHIAPGHEVTVDLIRDLDASRPAGRSATVWLRRAVTAT